jgi:hypothetical protein
MEVAKLSFEALMNYLHTAIQDIPDPRQASNATKYSLSDAFLGAFSVFFMQCESFLEHQRQMNARLGKSNAQTLFGMFEVPSTPQIRNILDGIPDSKLSGVFSSVYQALHREGHLEPFSFLGGLLIALDGTRYFDSHKICCQNCSSRKHKNGSVTYFHSAILPAIVAPGQSQVISLAPEFIRPQDGHKKQDCEVAAAKRWLTAHKSEFIGEKITLLGDDLYSREPMCREVLSSNMSFVFTCLPESHIALYEWVNHLDSIGEVKTLEIEKQNKTTKEVWYYRYVEDVPLTYEDKALGVNWCELTVVRESDGKILYQNSYITNHELDEDTVPSVVAAGRCRWKTENENHNVLKTKGYNLEHNFGHGDNHLAACLLTLNLLSFLFHTVLEFVDKQYLKIRKKRVTRKGFFQDILSITKYFLFDSWQLLLDFMLDGLDSNQRANSS